MPEPLTDGFNDLSSGMDSSKTAETIDARAAALLTNVVTRDGMAATRPQFRRVEVWVTETLRDGCFQGAAGYYNPATGLSRLVAAVDGHIYVIDPRLGTMEDLSESSGLINDPTAETYFAQAESFLVINNGKDTPLIYNGSQLRRASADEVPTGTLMAYGQGRLFVASSDRRAITAGDLAYGGSTSRVGITLSTPDGTRTKITTSAAHTLTDGDSVTITGHSSTPSINGTWTIATINATQFTIPAVLTSGGGGGFVDKANAIRESDVLRFTERTYIAESGTFRLPASMGQITAMFFFPVQDTGTGQGDLFVSGRTGACTFRVGEPRTTWLNIQFQRVALTEIGVCGARAFAQVNGDVFFGSDDGIRSYRNARAEFGSYGNTPLSAEMQRIIRPTRLPVLFRASMAHFDNRLLYTTSPKIQPARDQTTPERVLFQSLTALDFQQSSRISKGNLAAYDGIWTGLDVQQLIPLRFTHEQRLYAWCWQKSETGDEAQRANQIWEITTRQTGYDEWQTCSGSKRTEPTKCTVETRAFTFNGWADLKQLVRADLWLGRIRGEVDLCASWRPDLHGGGFFAWECINLSAGECAQLHGQTLTVTVPSGASVVKTPFDAPVLTLGNSGLYTGDEATGLVGGTSSTSDTIAIWNGSGYTTYYYKTGGAAPLGWRKGGSQIEQSGATLGAYISAFGYSGPWFIINRRGGRPPFDWHPVCPKPEIRPPLQAAQVRLTTPPAHEDKLRKWRGDRGYSFQLRFDWTGMLQLQKVLAHATQEVQASQGDPLNSSISDPGDDDLRPPSLRDPVHDPDWAHFIVPSIPCLVDDQTPTPTPTPTPSGTVIPTVTPTPTPLITPTPPPTPTPTPTITPTATPTATPSVPPTAPPTPSVPAPTPTISPTPTPTPTPSETPPPSMTSNMDFTLTMTPTMTLTPTPSETPPPSMSTFPEFSVEDGTPTIEPPETPPPTDVTPTPSIPPTPTPSVTPSFEPPTESDVPDPTPTLEPTPTE